jgi:sodium/hydrogen antiporter
MLLSLVRTPLPQRERLTAAWFGPKGFASVVYGLLALQSGIAERELVFDLVGVTIALSIVLHSSTDVRSRGCCASNPPTNCPRADQLLMSPPTPDTEPSTPQTE